MKKALCIMAILLLLCGCSEKHFNTLSPEEARSALLKAAGEGNLNEVKQLLANGADINAKDKDGKTALHLAAFACGGYQWEVAKLLIASGADINAKDGNGLTPLHLAIADCDIDMVKLLAASGADLNVRDEKGATALHHVAVSSPGSDTQNCNQDEIIDFLLSKGLYIDARDDKGMTPFQWAVSEGNIYTWSLFLDHGADVNATDYEGRTALDLVLDEGFSFIVPMIRDEGALTGKTDCANIVEAVKHLDVAKVREFLARGSDVDMKDTGGWAALHYSAEKCNPEIAEILIENGASLNLAASDGRTPLHVAVGYSGWSGVAELLLSRGCDVNALASNGKTPLDCADDGNMEELLRRYGAVSGKDPNPGKDE